MEIERDVQGNLIVNGYLVEQTGVCNCTAAPLEGQHDMLCGYEPVADIQNQVIPRSAE